MSYEEIYQKFIDYMHNPAMAFSESEHLMPTITSYITPEEADFLTGFPFVNMSLAEIAEIKKMEV